jgi:hypothetical protein
MWSAWQIDPRMKTTDLVHTTLSYLLRSICILSTHLRLGLPSCPFLYGLPTNILSPMVKMVILNNFPSRSMILQASLRNHVSARPNARHEHSDLGYEYCSTRDVLSVSCHPVEKETRWWPDPATQRRPVIVMQRGKIWHKRRKINTYAF